MMKIIGRLNREKNKTVGYTHISKKIQYLPNFRYCGKIEKQIWSFDPYGLPS